jgi:hypothetical protein
MNSQAVVNNREASKRRDRGRNDGLGPHLSLRRVGSRESLGARPNDLFASTPSVHSLPKGPTRRLAAYSQSRSRSAHSQLLSQGPDSLLGGRSVDQLIVSSLAAWTLADPRSLEGTGTREGELERLQLDGFRAA